jgi:hypothetical protein
MQNTWPFEGMARHFQKFRPRKTAATMMASEQTGSISIVADVASTGEMKVSHLRHAATKLAH